MDVWLELLGGIAGVAAVALAGSRFAAGGANALAGLVAGWREPGWPRGLQEDDEVRWAWRSPGQPQARDTGEEADVQPIDARLEWRAR